MLQENLKLHIINVQSCEENRHWTALTPAGGEGGAVLPSLVETLVLQVGPGSGAPLVSIGTPVGRDLRPVVPLGALARETRRWRVLAWKLWKEETLIEMRRLTE